MLNYSLWDGETPLMLPNGIQASKDDPQEFAKNVGIAPVGAIMIGQAGGVTMFAANLALMRMNNGIDDSLPDAEAVAAIAEILNAPPPAPEPDATERIAAALEYQNISALAAEGFAVDETLVAKNYERGLWSDAMVAKTMGEAAVGRGLLSTEQLNAVSGGTIIGGGEIPSKMS